MVLATIFGMAAAAWAAVVAFNRYSVSHPEETAATVRVIRQSVGVTLTIANAVRGVLDALALIQRATQPAPAGTSSPSQGGPPVPVRLSRED